MNMNNILKETYTTYAYTVQQRFHNLFFNNNFIGEFEFQISEFSYIC